MLYKAKGKVRTLVQCQTGFIIIVHIQIIIVHSYSHTHTHTQFLSFKFRLFSVESCLKCCDIKRVEGGKKLMS